MSKIIGFVNSARSPKRNARFLKSNWSRTRYCCNFYTHVYTPIFYTFQTIRDSFAWVERRVQLTDGDCGRSSTCFNVYKKMATNYRKNDFVNRTEYYIGRHESPTTLGYGQAFVRVGNAYASETVSISCRKLIISSDSLL